MSSFPPTPDPWQRYYDQRKDIDSVAFELGGRYDKLALAVSGGGFVVSIAFLEKIATDPPFWVRWLLVFAWVLFGVSIVFQLFALRYSQQAQQHKIRDLDLDYLHDRDATLRTDYSAMDLSALAIKNTRNANEVAAWAMIAGLLFISAFAACAFLCKPHQDTTAYERKTETRTETVTETRINQGGGIRSESPTSKSTQTTAKPTEKKMSENDKKKLKEIKESKGSYVPPPNAIKPPAPTAPIPKPAENQKPEE